MDREYKVLSALQNSNVPVPKVFHLCTDDTVLGSWFYVMEYIEGRVFLDPALPDLTHAQRGCVYDEANRVLAAIHAIDINATYLSDFGRPGNYYERQVNRWTKQYRASETQRIEAMEILMGWLPDHIPEDDGRISLIHGDYRLGNIMFAPDTMKVVAILDWELSTLGHPIADLAYLCMQRRLGRDAPIVGLADLDLVHVVAAEERGEAGEGLLARAADTDEQGVAPGLGDDARHAAHVADGVLEQDQVHRGVELVVLVERGDEHPRDGVDRLHARVRAVVVLPPFDKVAEQQVAGRKRPALGPGVVEVLKVLLGGLPEQAVKGVEVRRGDEPVGVHPLALVQPEVDHVAGAPDGARRRGEQALKERGQVAEVELVVELDGGREERV